MVYFPSEPRSKIGQGEDSGNAVLVDPYMGLSSRYIALLERTSALYRLNATLSDQRTLFFLELDDM